MDQIFNPNVAYVLLMVGLMVGLFAMLSPGTGVIEVGAVFTVLVAAYIAINLSLRWWAAVILILSFIPLVLAVRRPAQRQRFALLAASFLLLTLGALFLFEPTSGLFAIHPLLILLMNTLVIASCGFLARQAFEAFTSRKVMDPDQLVGMQGSASSDIKGQGSVYVNGESWTATSDSFIPSGSPVRVTRRTGLILEVEPLPRDSIGS